MFVLFVGWNFSRNLTSSLSECLDYREIVRLNVLPWYGKRLLKNHQLHACVDQSLLKQRPKNIDCATSTLIIYTSRLHKWFVAIVLLNFDHEIYLFLKTKKKGLHSKNSRNNLTNYHYIRKNESRKWRIKKRMFEYFISNLIY